MNVNKLVIDDYDLLVQNGNIGIYNQCEVMEIFGIKDKKVFNIYTLITFQDSKEILDKPKLLTKKPIKLTKDIKFGMRRHILSLTAIRNVFINLLTNQNLSLVHNEVSLLSKMDVKAKQFVEPDATFDVQINKILKNNFHNGSYLIEGFDVSKELVSCLFDNKVLEKLNSEIMNIIPINLMAMTDRLGNIIFQFPSTIFNHEVFTDKIEQHIYFKLFWNKKISAKPKVSFSVFNRHDNVITGFASKSHISENEMLNFTSENMIDYYFYNEDKNLIIASRTYISTNSINLNGVMISPQPRVFKLNSEVQKKSSWFIFYEQYNRK